MVRLKLLRFVPGRDDHGKTCVFAVVSGTRDCVRMPGHKALSYTGFQGEVFQATGRLFRHPEVEAEKPGTARNAKWLEVVERITGLHEASGEAASVAEVPEDQEGGSR